MNSKLLVPFVLILLFISVQIYGQHIAMTFQEGEKMGLTLDSLNKIYEDAFNVDTSKAVFKTDAEQDIMHSSYVKLLQDFGKFLTNNNFIWEKRTRCEQRIYFNKDGYIDYYLYNFITKNVKPEDQLSIEKQKEFDRLLNLFIKDYKFALTAKVKFAQCSPTTYMPKESK